MVSIQYTPIPQQEIIIHPSSGMSSYAVVDTDSYLGQALQGMMQNAGPYIGWTLDQWVQAFTAQAQQRCNAYPESCSVSPSALGQKYGAIAFQLMQGVSAPVQQQQSTPQLTPVTQVAPVTTITIPQSIAPIPGTDPSTINPYPGVVIQTTGSGDISVPNGGLPGIPNPSLYPDYITQGNVSQGAVSDNTTQTQIAQSGGNPVPVNVPPGTFVLPTSLSWLGNTFAIGGMNIPVWMGLAGLAGLVMLNSQNKGRGRYN